MQTNNSKEKVRQLQNKLYLTAKKCSSRRFHALYDKVYRDDVMYEAWKRVKANQGSSGVDGITIEDIEASGVNRYLTGIQTELKSGTYRPLPVRRVMIPKPDGSQRPLGIPCVKDRIVQMATKIAIEPVFEADFKDCSYGFRPKRSAKQALEVVRKACNNKGYYVVDADIEKFFDNVNQDKLMALIELRISDRRIQKTHKAVAEIRDSQWEHPRNKRTGNEPRLGYFAIISKYLLEHARPTVGKVWTYPWNTRKVCG